MLPPLPHNKGRSSGITFRDFSTYTKRSLVKRRAQTDYYRPRDSNLGFWGLWRRAATYRGIQQVHNRPTNIAGTIIMENKVETT